MNLFFTIIGVFILSLGIYVGNSLVSFIGGLLFGYFFTKTFVSVKSKTLQYDSGRNDLDELRERVKRCNEIIDDGRYFPPFDQMLTLHEMKKRIAELEAGKR